MPFLIETSQLLEEVIVLAAAARPACRLSLSVHLPKYLGNSAIVNVRSTKALAVPLTTSNYSPLQALGNMSDQKSVPVSASASNTFEDLSGISTSAFSNPYDALISACEDDPVR
jgi:hypothetical protein